MTLKIKYIGVASLMAATLGASAQDLHESIQVEGKYNPEIIHQERINVLPNALQFPMESHPLDYTRTGVTAYTAPDFLNLPALTLDKGYVPVRNRGYATLGLGSFLQSDLSAGYRFVDTDATVAGAALQFNSQSLDRPFRRQHVRDLRRIYDGTLSLYGSHFIDKVGTISATFDYRLGYFNYLTCGNFGVLKPTQTLNNTRLFVGWQTPNNKKTAIYAGVRYDYFGFRALPYAFAANTPSGMEMQDLKGTRENHVTLLAGVNHPMGGKQHIGLDLRAHILSYGENALADLSTYGLVTLSPYYRFSYGLLNINAGLNLDFAMNAGVSGHKYDAFHVSPKVTLDYRRDGIGLYLHLLGGSKVQSMQMLESQDFYTMPSLVNTKPEFSPLDASLGVNIGPFSGFSAGMHFDYKIVNNHILQGTYLAQLAGIYSYDANLDPDLATLYTLNQCRGFRVGAELNYAYNDLLTLSAAAAFAPQNGKTGWYDGADRPRWTLDASATVKPIKDLRLTLAYNFRGVRKVYRKSVAPDEQNPAALAYSLHSTRLRDITNLSFRAEYRLPIQQNASVFVKLGNLLCVKADALYPVPYAYPYSTIDFLAGINFTF